MAKEKKKPGRPPLKAKDKKRYIYTIRIDEELNQALKSQAKAEKETIAGISRKALEEYLERARNDKN